jgi:predicted glycosyltransferase
MGLGMRVIWFDALTSKQLLIAASLKNYLSPRGYDVIITSRRYDAIEGLVETLGIDAILIGGYAETLYEKLRIDIDRMSRLLGVLHPRLNDLVAGVSYPNPAEARIIYGLGKPLIILSDTPHSIHVNRLTLPIASYLVYSECIEDIEWKPYLLPHTRVVRYPGVDELSWIFYLEDAHDARHIKRLGLEEKSYVVIRPEESKASYYRWGSMEETWFKLIERILSMSLRIVFLPRYEDQRRAVENRYKGEIERERIVIPPPGKAIGPALAKHSVAVVTGGGTMAREAALYGVPGITFFPLELSVDKCLATRNAPIYRVEGIEKVIEIVGNAMRNPEENMENTRKAIQGMSPPQETIYRILASL